LCDNLSPIQRSRSVVRDRSTLTVLRGSSRDRLHASRKNEPNVSARPAGRSVRTAAPVTNAGVAASFPTMSTGVHAYDRDLLRRTREGDPEAFASFYRARRGDVLGFLRVRVPSAELAADLMCETFANALVAVHDLEDRELPMVPLAWLLTIARNELIDSVRRGRVENDTRRRLAIEPLELSDRDIAEIDQAAADADLLAQLREVLPEDQLHALTARVIDGRDYAEIAHDLQTSQSVVRKRVSRALAYLRSIRQEAS
jgi:RNA polymerase sigma factor (sigma-70 family)